MSSKTETLEFLEHIDLMINTGQYDKAITALERELGEKTTHDHNIYLKKISECYKNIGDYENAHKFIDIRLEIAEALYEYMIKKASEGWLGFESTEYKNAEKNLVITLERKSSIYLEESKAKKKGSNFEDAENILKDAEDTVEKALVILPLYYPSLVRKISILAEKQDFNGAHKTVDLLIAKTTKHLPNTARADHYLIALRTKAELYHSTANYHKSAKNYKIANKSFPKAIDFIEKALEFNPNNKTTLTSAINIYSDSGNKEKAKYYEDRLANLKNRKNTGHKQGKQNNTVSIDISKNNTEKNTYEDLDDINITANQSQIEHPEKSKTQSEEKDNNIDIKEEKDPQTPIKKIRKRSYKEQIPEKIEIKFEEEIGQEKDSNSITSKKLENSSSLETKPSDDRQKQTLSDIQTLIDNGDYPGAIAILEEELEEDPKHSIYLGKLSDTYKHAGDYHNAHKFIDMRRSPAENLYKALRKENEAGLIQTESPEHKNYKAAKSDLVIVYIKKTLIYLEESKNKKEKLVSAEKIIDKALEIQPKNHDALTIKIDILRRKEDFTKALEFANVFLQATIEAINSPKTRDLNRAKKDHATALQIQEVLSPYRKTEVERHIRKLIQQRDFGPAATILHAELADQPKHKKYLQLLSDCYKHLNDFHSAHHYLDKTRTNIENSYKDLHQKVQDGSIDKRSQEYQEYKGARNDIVVFFEKKAAIYLAENKNEEASSEIAKQKLEKAENTINKALDISPEHHGALTRKVSILRKKEDFKGAHKIADFLLERAIKNLDSGKNSSDYSTALQMKADLYQFEGKIHKSKGSDDKSNECFTEAINYIEQAIKANPSNTNVLTKARELYREIGNKRKATEYDNKISLINRDRT